MSPAGFIKDANGAEVLIERSNGGYQIWVGDEMILEFTPEQFNRLIDECVDVYDPTGVVPA